MRHVVEVPVAGENLYDQMNRMRGWLDHRRFEPSSFRLSQVGNRQVVRVVFKSQSEAMAFAPEFGGSLLASSVPDVAIA
jgi:hypothetical protein